MRTWAVLALLTASAVGCKASSRTSPPPPRRIVASFQGQVDAATGAVRITRAAATAAPAGFVELPVVEDGVPGSGPADTVELVTEKMPVAPDPRTIAGGCGTYDGFEGWITLRSFYAGKVLRNAYVEITSMSRTGREACNSAPAPEGLSAQYGLFSYGTLGAAGTSVSSAIVPWRFQVPDQSSFTFEGRVVADVDVDATPPAVASVTPAPGKVGVATGATVSVTFGEPVDPASVTTVTFSIGGPDGAIDGTIAADASNQVFTFTPASPLGAEALYSVAVGSGVRDLAGNALSPAYASTFYTVTARQDLLAASHAPVLNHAVAYDATGGTGLAAWSATTQGGTALVYATWDGTAWSGGTVLATDPGNTYGSPLRIAVDASGQFLLVWCALDAVRSARFQSGALLGSVVDLPLLQSPGAQPSPVLSDLAASSPAPSRFLVGRAGSDNRVTAWSWDGSTWSAETLVGSVWRDPSGTGRLLGLSGSTLYWIGSDGSSVQASTFSGSWGSPVAVKTLAAGDGNPNSLAVASDARTVVAFATSAGRVWAGVGSGTTFPSFTDVAGTSFVYGAPPLAASAYGDEYAIAWVNPADGKGFASFWDGSSWPTSPAQPFASGAVDVGLAGYAGTGAGAFAAAFTVTDPGSSAASVWVVPSGGSPGARTWLSPAQVEESASTAREPGVAVSGATAAVHWTQADDAGHELMVRPYDGGVVGAPAVASWAQPFPASAANVRAAANGRGEVLAVWTQEDAGSTSVFAALHGPTGWSAPVRVLSRAASPDVASDGTGFLVAASAESSTTPSAHDLVAVPYEGGAPGTLERVATDITGLPRVASDGTVYAAGWTGGGAVSGALRIAGAWRPPLTLGSGSGVALAGRPGGFLWAWSDGSEVQQKRASGSGTSWTMVSYFGTGPKPDEIAAGAGPAGFYVAIRAGDAVLGWTLTDDTDPYWPLFPSTLATGNVPSCEGPRVAANGDRYLVGWNCADDLETVETDGATVASRTSHLTGYFNWTGAPPAANAFAIAAGPAATFRLVYSSFIDGRVYGRESVAGAWGPAVRLDDRPDPARSVAVAWDGGAWLTAWQQASAAAPSVDDLVAWWAW